MGLNQAGLRHPTSVVLALIAAGMTAGTGTLASAEPLANCMTRILADVPAEEAREQVKSKGGTFGPVTRIKVSRQTGRMVYCSGPSYCYWSNALELVSPCRIKRDNDVHDNDWFVYFTR